MSLLLHSSMEFPDFVPSEAREWYSRMSEGGFSDRRLQEATIRLVTDKRMEKVYASLSKGALCYNEWEVILSTAAWTATMDWTDIRDQRKVMAARRTRVLELLDELDTELCLMDGDQGECSAPSLKFADIRSDIEQLLNMVTAENLPVSPEVAIAIESRKPNEFDSAVRWFKKSTDESGYSLGKIAEARLFDLIEVALPAECTKVQYKNSKNPRTYSNDQQKSAAVKSILRLKVKS